MIGYRTNARQRYMTGNQQKETNVTPRAKQETETHVEKTTKETTTPAAQPEVGSVPPQQQPSEQEVREHEQAVRGSTHSTG